MPHAPPGTLRRMTQHWSHRRRHRAAEEVPVLRLPAAVTAEVDAADGADVPLTTPPVKVPVMLMFAAVRDVTPVIVGALNDEAVIAPASEGRHRERAVGHQAGGVGRELHRLGAGLERDACGIGSEDATEHREVGGDVDSGRRERDALAAGAGVGQQHLRGRVLALGHVERQGPVGDPLRADT